MEDKKIKYPFKNFVKNIIVGIILMLSVFFMMPIINGFSNNVAGDDVNATGYATVKCYGYNGDGSISELRVSNGKYVYINNYWDPSAGPTNGGDSVRLEQKSNNIPAGVKYTIAGRNSQHYYVIGAFWGTGGDFSVGNLAYFGNTMTFASGYSYSLLFSANADRIIPTTTNYINVDGNEWQSNYPIKAANYTYSHNEVFNGNKITLGKNPNVDESYMDNGEKHIPKIDFESSCSYSSFSGQLKARSDFNSSLIQSGKEYYTWISYSNTSSGGVKKFLNFCDANGYQRSSVEVDCEAVKLDKTNVNFKVQLKQVFSPDGNKISNGLVNGKIQFNIYNSTDLQLFADEVNDGFLNNVTSNYRAVLQNNIYSYTGDPIGKDGENNAFKGEFDGNGKEITTAVINPIFKGLGVYRSKIKKGITQKWYVDTYDFGFFGYIESNSLIKDLNLGTVCVASYSLKIYYMTGSVENSITTSSLSPSSDSNFGSLCAVNRGTIENVFINSCSLKFELCAAAGIKCGAIAGALSNAEIRNSKVNSFSINIEKSSNFTSGKDDTANDYNLGGIAGYIENSTIEDTTINTYNVNKCSWQKHDKNDFYAGGIVGRQKNSVLESCHVKGGTQDFTGVYHTNTVAIGGISGLIEGIGRNSSYSVIGCTSKNIITVDGMSGGTSGNQDEDYFCVGGIAGVVRNGRIYKSDYAISGKVTLKSGVAKGWFQLWATKYYGVYFGGLIGSCEQNSTLPDSLTHIDGGVDFSGKKIECLGFGLFTGKLTEKVTVANCYSVIGSKDKKIPTYNVEGIHNGVSNYGEKYGLFGVADNNNIIMQNCYWATYNFNDGGVTGSLDLNSNNIVTKDQLNQLFAGYSRSRWRQIYDLKSITQIGDTPKEIVQMHDYDSSRNYTKTWTEQVIVPIYGYNSSIQSNWIDSTTAAPFLLSNYSGYKNILIDCTKTGGETIRLSSEMLDSSSGFVYSDASNGGVKYIYGTIAGNATFPSTKSTNVKGLVSKYISGYGYLDCAGLSIYPSGYDENGNLTDIITDLADIPNGNITLYPVWTNDNSQTLKSPVQLLVGKDKTLLGDGESISVEVTDIHGSSSNMKIKASKINGDSFYCWEYEITIENLAVGLTVSMLTSNFYLTNDYNNYFEICFNTNVFNEYEFDESENKFNINYIDDKGTGLRKFSDYTSTMGFANASNIYVHVFRNIQVYCGVADVSVNSQPVNGTSGGVSGSFYLTKYYEVRQVPFFVTERGNGCIALFESFENMTVDGYSFGNLSWQGKDTWIALGKMKVQTNTSGLIKKVNNTSGTVVGTTFVSHAKGSGVTSFAQDSYKWWSEGSALYPLYMIYGDPERELIVEYYNEYNVKSKYIDVIKLKPGVTSYAFSSTREHIKTYNETKLGFQKRYDFVGWKLSTNYGEVRIYAELEFGVPEEWFAKGTGLTVKLYPVFVTKNGASIKDAVLKSSQKSFGSTFDVESPEDLIYCTYLTNFEKETYYNLNINIKNNINMSGYENLMSIGSGIYASGDYSSAGGYIVHHNYYSGTINGNGNIISNLKIYGEYYARRIAFEKNTTNTYPLKIYYSAANTSYESTRLRLPDIGFIANATNANIYGLNLVDINFNVNKSQLGNYINYMGGIIGRAVSCEVKNCLVSGKIGYYGSLYQGGIIGVLSNATDDSIISECVSKVTLSSDSWVGSIVGCIQEIKNSTVAMYSCFDLC